MASTATVAPVAAPRPRPRVLSKLHLPSGSSQYMGNRVIRVCHKDTRIKFGDYDAAGNSENPEPSQQRVEFIDDPRGPTLDPAKQNTSFKYEAVCKNMSVVASVYYAIQPDMCSKQQLRPRNTFFAISSASTPNGRVVALGGGRGIQMADLESRGIKCFALRVDPLDIRRIALLCPDPAYREYFRVVRTYSNTSVIKSAEDCLLRAAATELPPVTYLRMQEFMESGVMILLPGDIIYVYPSNKTKHGIYYGQYRARVELRLRATDPELPAEDPGAVWYPKLWKIEEPNRTLCL